MTFIKSKKVTAAITMATILVAATALSMSAANAEPPDSSRFSSGSGGSGDPTAVANIISYKHSPGVVRLQLWCSTGKADWLEVGYSTGVFSGNLISSSNRNRSSNEVWKSVGSGSPVRVRGYCHKSTWTYASALSYYITAY